MKPESVDHKIISSLPYLSEKEKKAVWSVVKTFAEENESFELSEEQLAELDKRWKEYKNGTAKLYSWEEVKNRLQKKTKSTRNK
ncbi:MAG TPA: addiction module protein [Cytophagaceae bacterium]|jgi:putative addiction module component (TIGR02574 family)|nr:addiction module protein [Cytophagaceae bacterium]